MIFKAIFFIFAYLLIGIAVLEGVLWHDRKVGFVDSWLYDEKDDVEQSLVVILWPGVLPKLWIYLLCIGLKYLIKAVRIFFTTIVYLIAAIIDKDREESEIKNDKRRKE